mgnify:CR=1 FL=1
METLGYFLIVFTAGHDTTKNALVGGLQALAAHPEEFAKLQKAVSNLRNSLMEAVGE